MMLARARLGKDENIPSRCRHHLGLLHSCTDRVLENGLREPNDAFPQGFETSMDPVPLKNILDYRGKWTKVLEE